MDTSAVGARLAWIKQQLKQAEDERRELNEIEAEVRSHG